MTCPHETRDLNATKVFPGSRFGGATVLVMALFIALMILNGCSVGPHYQRPDVQTPPAYKETGDWKQAEPADASIRGKWWEVFDDPQLNSLEDQATTANQSVAAALDAFLAARAMVREARSQYFPTVTVNPSITNQRLPSFRGAGGSVTSSGGTGTTTTTTSSSSNVLTDYLLPFDASWEPDLWGRVRNTVASNVAAAQSSAANLQNTRLTVQAEIAVDYYQLRAQDALKRLLDETVTAYQQSLMLTQAQYETGIASDENVAQAETQLKTTEAQDTNLGIARAQYEHAIAVLVGQPASVFSIPTQPLNATPPGIPVALPSQLLERRPDIAAAERTMAQANAQIGVARAAYFPTVTLTGEAGLESSSLASWFDWPSRVWSVGAALSQTLFDAGLRRATVEQYRAMYDEDVANYRNTVLTAFQQVEDNLAMLRILEVQIQQQNEAVEAADRNLTLANDRYKLGIDPYLNVITAQATYLTNQETAVNLRMQQMTASVGLIKALGGGWSASQLPSPKDVATTAPVAAASNQGK